MREGSSIAATKARAINCPTPGMVINRRQAAEALVIRLISASVRAAIRPRTAADRPAIPSLALRALSMKATASDRGDPCHHCARGRRTRPQDDGAYFARKQDCGACALKLRKIARSIHEAARDKPVRRADFVVADAVPPNPSAWRQIPVDREESREFSAFAPFSRGRIA
jgi:hypothetical protein